MECAKLIKLWGGRGDGGGGRLYGVAWGFMTQVVEKCEAEGCRKCEKWSCDDMQAQEGRLAEGL